MRHFKIKLVLINVDNKIRKGYGFQTFVFTRNHLFIKVNEVTLNPLP